MKVTLTHDGKSVELDLTAEQMASLGLKEEKKKTGYEMVENGERFFHDTEFATVMFRKIGTLGLCDIDLGIEYYDAANYYSHPQVAENNARADRLMRQLRRYAAEHGGIPSAEDWRDRHVSKWSVVIDHAVHSTVAIRMVVNFDLQQPSNVYFKSEEACKAAIEEFKDELIWYFTEYQPMLY